MKTVISGLALLLNLCPAAVVRVPSEQPNIQAGLSAALSGDTVLVAAGTYVEFLTWPARDGITLLSEFGPDSTVIDGLHKVLVVRMDAIEYTSATVLRGFTIARGEQAVPGSLGAGIRCSGSPVICYNRIVNNRLVAYGYGAGVYASGAPVFHHNLVIGDTIANIDGGGLRYGSGVYCAGSGVFYQNVFMDNAALGGGGGFWYGGGLCLTGGSPVVFSNLFLGNRVGTTTGGVAWGGGLYQENCAAYIVNNTFVANVCSTAIAYGGAAFLSQPWTTVFKNNVLVHNRAEGVVPMGGGVAAYVDTLNDTAVLDYNDAWANTPTNYYACHPGPHALSLDPLFITGPRGAYYLSQVAAGQAEDSPCLDAGDTLSMTAPLDLDSLLHAWTTRTDTLPDAGVIDLGLHYEFSPQIGVSEQASLPRLRPTLQVSPNPCRSVAVLHLTTGPLDRSTTSLRIFDAQGRLVHSSFVLRASSFRLDVASMPAGVYLARLGIATARFVVER
ncbi:MAG: T9SS type A sorting domain-containing protein [candidate division WOR-3 bacterium]|nr:T9SS type A sorting domain-containing protein [candidate division WOR-3 bacterium]